MLIQTDIKEAPVDLDQISQSNLTAQTIELIDSDFPKIYKLKSLEPKSKGIIVINPGLCTRHLHLLEPFIGYQLSRLGFTVYSLNTLDLQNYGLNHKNPFERQELTLNAFGKISNLHPNEKIISLGHSLGCIDLLRTQPENIAASIFISPGFKGDKKRFSLKKFLEYFVAFFTGKELNLSPHGTQARPELADYKTDFVHPSFIWNLQAYAHGLENSHHWPLNKPCLVWLGSKEASDGIMEMQQPLRWVQIMKELNPQTKFIMDVEAGHEPGWKNAKHAESLAVQINNWFNETLL